MKKTITVRAVKPADASRLAEIYKPYVENTAVSFELTPPDASEMENRITTVTRKYPFFVAVYENRVVGYAYASVFKNRAAYDHCAELSVYVEGAMCGKGVGTLLYKVLERALKNMGVKNAYACIAYPDGAEDETLTKGSVRFHYARGYAICGHFTNCGYKFNRYYSMVWMEKILS